ncbi:MAG: winged helix-turn-helix domain-containing protein, partial [Myxococcota bacterium]
ARELPRALALAPPGVEVDGARLSLPLDVDPEAVAVAAERHAAPDRFAVGPWLVDPDGQRMVGPGARTEALSPLEVGLLRALAAAGGAPVDRDRLLTEVWGYRPGVVTRAVDHLVARLRTRIEPDPARPRWLVSERSRGYRLVTEATGDGAPIEAPAGRIGRDDDIARVLAAWDRGTRVVTVCGAPGTGKSVVARAAAARIGGLVAATSHPWPAGPVLMDDLDGPDRDEADDWVRATGQRVIRSAPAPLGLRGEARVVIGGLAAEHGRALATREAARLGVTLGDGEAAALAEACDGHPLAVALAVERIPLLGLSALVAAIHADPLTVLRVPFRHPPRHASLAAALAWDPPPAATRAVDGRLAAGAPVDPTSPDLADALARGLAVRSGAELRPAPLFARWGAP